MAGTFEYAPEFFNRGSFQEAQAVIVTAGGGLSVEERWKIETAWLAERIKFPDDGIVIDYGCGAGRVAKAVGRPVLGVDISLDMLIYATQYVGRVDFLPTSPVGLELLVRSGFRASGAMAVWSLQHVADVQGTVDLLMSALRPGAPFWMLDLCERHIPATRKGDNLVMVMINDGKSVLDALAPWCVEESCETLDVWKEEVANPGTLRKFTRKDV